MGDREVDWERDLNTQICYQIFAFGRRERERALEREREKKSESESESERESEREKEREKERERERERQVVLRQDGGAFLRRFFFFSEALFFFLPQYCGRMEARTRTCLQDECMEARTPTLQKRGAHT